MKRLVLALLLLSISVLNLYSQAPVSMYDDKGGDANKIFNFHPTDISAYFSVTAFLKIYKDRELDRVQAAARVKGTTTLVVIDDENSEYGQALKKAFADNWKYTPYKIISPAQVAHFARIKGNSFFMMARDEHYETTGTNGKGQTVFIHGPPNIYYKTDSMEHKPSSKFFSGNENYYVSTYIFMIGLRTGAIEDDTTEERCTESFSIADYCMPNLEYNNEGYEKTLALKQEEKAVAPDLGTIVKNFSKDLDYMYVRKKEKKGTYQEAKYTMPYKGNSIKFRLDMMAYEGGADTWKDDVLYINNGLCNNFSRAAIAGLLGINDEKAKLVPPSAIDSLKKNPDNKQVIIWDMENDEFGNYQITSTNGTELIGLYKEGANEILNKNRGAQNGDYQTEKCDLVRDSKSYSFKFFYATYGQKCKNIIKNKTLYLNNTGIDELGRKIMLKILGMDDKNVQLVPPYVIDSVVHKGNNNSLIFSANAMDESNHYMITTTDGVEMIGIQPAGFNKEIGEFDLTGQDKWSERSKFSMK